MFGDLGWMYVWIGLRQNFLGFIVSGWDLIRVICVLVSLDFDFSFGMCVVVWYLVSDSGDFRGNAVLIYWYFVLL